MADAGLFKIYIPELSRRAGEHIMKNMQTQVWAAGNIFALCCLLLFLCPSSFAFEKKPVTATRQEMDLSGSLREREAALAKKEKDLAKKEEELAALQKEVDEKLDRLIVQQQKLKETLAELKAVKDKQFKNLIKIYSAMSASKVAPLLNQMKDEEAVEILKAMKAEAVAKIIPKLDQKKAVRLSKQLGLI